VTTLERPAKSHASPETTTSDRAKSERRLGFYLTLPSYIVMILVTAYPLGYALVLSLYNYRITDPGGRTFVGLQNYLVILTDPAWWNDFMTTLLITVITVAVELVLGFWFAYVMLRIIRGRGPLRTAILISYGIVTVVSAFIWRYAFAIDSGFINQWLNLGGISTGSAIGGRRSSSSACPRSGRPHRSSHCCCSPDWCRYPRTCRRRPRSTAQPPGSACTR